MTKKTAKPFDFLSTGYRTHSVGEGIQKAVPFKKNLGFKTRLRPWDMCSEAGCSSATESGKKEKDPEQRYCRHHLPKNVELFKRETDLGKLRHALCSSDQKASSCRLGNRSLTSTTEGDLSWTPLLYPRCLVPVDVDGQHSNCRCWVQHEKIEHRYSRTLRCLRYDYYVVKKNPRTTCHCLPHIRWNRKRVPFVFGVDKAPKEF
jgi:hypothetical protein